MSSSPFVPVRLLRAPWPRGRAVRGRAENLSSNWEAGAAGSLSGDSLCPLLLATSHLQRLPEAQLC